LDNSLNLFLYEHYRQLSMKGLIEESLKYICWIEFRIVYYSCLKYRKFKTIPVFENLFVIKRFNIIAKSYYKLSHICLSTYVCPSVCRNNSALTGSIFMKFGIFSNYRKSVKKIQVSLQSDKNDRYFTWRHVYIFIICRSVLPRMWNVSEKLWRNSKHTVYVHWSFS